jgi:iron(III) transport system substrate-binding protein
MKAKLIAVSIALMAVLLAAGGAAAQVISAYMGTSPDNNARIVKYINADMIIGCGSPLAFMAQKNGWADPYVSPAWQGTQDVFVDPEGHWYNIGNFSFVLVGNKDRLARAGKSMPASWKDLLDPQWKGEIIMPSPLSSGTANMMRFSWLALYGDEGGWEFLADLDKNIAFYTRSGNAPTDLVGRGEFTLGITSDENVKKRIDDGYPLIWSIPAEGTGYDGTFALIFKGTKQRDACRKVIDALGTQEFSDMMAGIGYLTPRPAANALYGKTPPKYIQLDLGKAAEDRPKNNEIWKRKFRTDFK